MVYLVHQINLRYIFDNFDNDILFAQISIQKLLVSTDEGEILEIWKDINSVPWMAVDLARDEMGIDEDTLLPGEIDD